MNPEIHPGDPDALFVPGIGEQPVRRVLRLADVDALVVTEVYGAGEAPIVGADGTALCRAIRSRGSVEPVLVKSVEQLAQTLVRILRDGDVIVTMGAGSIGSVPAELTQALAKGAGA